MATSNYSHASIGGLVQPAWQLAEASGVKKLENALKKHMRGHRAGTMIGLEGEQSNVIYCVWSGWISMSKSMPDGQRQIIDFALPGEFLNPSSGHTAGSGLHIEAVTNASIATIPETRWHELKEAIPQLARLESRVVAGAFSRLSERMLRLGKGSAEARIAHALIELCIRLRAIGQVEDDSFHIPLTQQQLGEFVGLSSVHVCRTIRRLSRSGVISMADHMDIDIHEMDHLAEIAGLDMDVLEEDIIPQL